MPPFKRRPNGNGNGNGKEPPKPKWTEKIKKTWQRVRKKENAPGNEPKRQITLKDKVTFEIIQVVNKTKFKNPQDAQLALGICLTAKEDREYFIKFREETRVRIKNLKIELETATGNLAVGLNGQLWKNEAMVKMATRHINAFHDNPPEELVKLAGRKEASKIWEGVRDVIIHASPDQ